VAGRVIRQCVAARELGFTTCGEPNPGGPRLADFPQATRIRAIRSGHFSSMQPLIDGRLTAPYSFSAMLASPGAPPVREWLRATPAFAARHRHRAEHPGSPNTVTTTVDRASIHEERVRGRGQSRETAGQYGNARVPRGVLLNHAVCCGKQHAAPRPHATSSTRSPMSTPTSSISLDQSRKNWPIRQQRTPESDGRTSLSVPSCEHRRRLL
jgi:hypothetical protein